MLEFHFVY